LPHHRWFSIIGERHGEVVALRAGVDHRSARSKIMVAVSLVTDCSEPAATKNAVGHGVSSLRAEDRAIPGSSTPGVTSRKVLNIPGPRTRSGPVAPLTAM